MRLGISLATGLVACMLAVAPAYAHGEKSQMAFLRMRTINWYDLHWSKAEVNVGDVVEITGKFNVFSAWPDALANPHTAFLNSGQPGPVFVREATFINGQFVPRSFSLEPGHRYEFKTVLRARRPGLWHVHVQMNVQSGGPIIGPGEWLRVNGSMADFHNPQTLITGQEVDLETLGIGNIYFWHFLWMAAGAAWVIYWFRRGGFIGRYLAVEAGNGDKMISTRDEKVAFGTLAAVLLVVIIGYSNAQSSYPRTLPLQSGHIDLPPSDPALYPKDVTAKLQRATYKVPGRELDMIVQVTNNTGSPLRIGEFAAAGVRFLNPDVMKEKQDYPRYLLAEQGLHLSDNEPIAPGATKSVTLIAQDAAWDIERLSDLYYDTNSAIGGLVFLYGEDGQRYVMEIGGPAIPMFRQI